VKTVNAVHAFIIQCVYFSIPSMTSEKVSIMSFKQGKITNRYFVNYSI